MQESNNKLKLLKKILKIVIMIFLTIIVTEIVYNITLPDDAEIEKSYNEKKEKFQLLEDVANSTIEEGIGICTQNIPSDITSTLRRIILFIIIILVMKKLNIMLK